MAYADFVTAMMALFIVLWLLNQSDKVKEAVAGYFNDPKGTASMLGTTMSGNGVTVTEDQSDLAKVKEKLEKEIKAQKELEKLSKQIEITITPEGLRIELFEDKNGTFYQSGSAQLSTSGQELLSLLAGELKKLPNSLLIEGHTDAMQYSTDTSYSNWELSADRANAARRLLQGDGVRRNQVTQVRGYADQFLRVKSNPYDPSNRRISILVKNAGGVPAPVIQNAKVIDGKTNPPAVNDTKPAKPEGKDAPAAEAGKAEGEPTAAEPMASTGLLGRLNRMLPGKKK